MSLSISLSNALSGLGVASRSAQVVSDNIANATTEGYSRREVQSSARQLGGAGAGVQFDGVQRIVNQTIVNERALASSALGSSETLSVFSLEALRVLGEPQEASSVVSVFANLEQALLEAESRPESNARLYDVLANLNSVAEKLNASSAETQRIRVRADTEIATAVETLNSNLQQLAELNNQVLRARATNQDYPALLDEQQRLLDTIGEFLPIKTFPRENDTIAVYSTTGARLLDSQTATFSFTPTKTITPDMTSVSGALSGLILDGTSIETGTENAPIGEGRLSALFEVRDSLAPELQSNLDALARELISRFEDPAIDPTLLPGDTGIFTDNGSVLNLANVVGLAARLQVNSAIDPEAGGELWRIRDGLNAATEGPAGNASLINSLSSTLNIPRNETGYSFDTGEASMSARISDFTANQGKKAVFGENRYVFNKNLFASLNDQVLSQGVNIDQELQKLLLIEQSFAANARVIQVTDDLMQILVGL